MLYQDFKYRFWVNRNQKIFFALMRKTQVHLCRCKSFQHSNYFKTLRVSLIFRYADGEHLHINLSHLWMFQHFSTLHWTRFIVLENQSDWLREICNACVYVWSWTWLIWIEINDDFWSMNSDNFGRLKGVV